MKKKRVLVYKYIYKYQISSFIVLEIGFEVLDLKLLMEFLQKLVSESPHYFQCLLVECHPNFHTVVELQGSVEPGRNEPNSVDLFAMLEIFTNKVKY